MPVVMAESRCLHCGNQFTYNPKSRRGKFCSLDCYRNGATLIVTEAHENHPDAWGRVSRQQVLDAWEGLKAGRFQTVAEMLKSLGYGGQAVPLKVRSAIPVDEYETVLSQWQERRYPRETVHRWLEKWANSGRPLREFKGDGVPSYPKLRHLFRLYFQSEYEDIIEAKAGKSYQIGRTFEYRCRDALRNAGYIVIRSAQSKGAADLVALRQGIVLLVQCKTRKDTMSKEEQKELLRVACLAGGLAVLAWRGRKGEKIHWEDLHGNSILL